MIEMYFDFRLYRLWKTRQHSKLLDYEDFLWQRNLSTESSRTTRCHEDPVKPDPVTERRAGAASSTQTVTPAFILDGAGRGGIRNEEAEELWHGGSQRLF